MMRSKQAGKEVTWRGMTRRMVGTEVQRGTKFLICQGDQSHWPWNSRRMEPFHDTVAQDRSPG